MRKVDTAVEELVNMIQRGELSYNQMSWMTGG